MDKASHITKENLSSFRKKNFPFYTFKEAEWHCTKKKYHPNVMHGYFDHQKESRSGEKKRKAKVVRKLVLFIGVSEKGEIGFVISQLNY